MQRLSVSGFDIFKGFLNRARQLELVDQVRAVAAAAPLSAPLTPWGKPMSVRMTSAGKYGWIADKKGYRYEAQHPRGTPWPAIPAVVADIWQELASDVRQPDCCLINYYSQNARMGLHQDRDEADFSWPVLSVSLGDPATFRMGGTNRADPTVSVKLESGDVVVMGGAARRAFHGVDRIHFGHSDLLQGGGRINLTLRVVD